MVQDDDIMIDVRQEPNRSNSFYIHCIDIVPYYSSPKPFKLACIANSIHIKYITICNWEESHIASGRFIFFTIFSLAHAHILTLCENSFSVTLCKQRYGQQRREASNFVSLQPSQKNLIILVLEFQKVYRFL